MRHLPVNWYEGLFLRPHHFQAADRYWTEALQTSEQWDHPYNYGLLAIDFSREALGNHQFEVRQLKARLRDGTLVALELGQEPDRLDLRSESGPAAPPSADLTEAFERESTIRVFLGIPKLKLGRPNVAGMENGVPLRFQPTRLPLPDEDTGTSEQEIELRQLNVKLLLSTQDTSGYELLPIAQVKRASAGAARPQLDESYIPPVIAIDAWQGLSRDIVRAIYDMVGQKIEVLSQQIASRNIGLDSRNPGDLERILMLNHLNSAYSVLSIVAFAQGVHPLTAYTELARLCGQLSLFEKTHRAEPIPPYDHDNLAGIFKDIQLRVERLLNAVRDYEYEQRYFVGVGMGMQVTLEPKWFNSDWQWYIGVNKGDLTTAECQELLSSGQLDWKLGSSRQVEILFKQRAPGLEMRPLDRPIRALPAQSDWLYYEVNKSEGPAWRDVQATQTLAMRLKDSVILNLDRLQGERQLVINSRGRSVPLQFALFAVPTRV